MNALVLALLLTIPSPDIMHDAAQRLYLHTIMMPIMWQYIRDEKCPYSDDLPPAEINGPFDDEPENETPPPPDEPEPDDIPWGPGNANS